MTKSIPVIEIFTVADLETNNGGRGGNGWGVGAGLGWSQLAGGPMV